MATAYFEYTDAERTFNKVHDMLNDYWKNIAINIFEWKGLEAISPSLTSEIIEENLYDNGNSLFFKDTNLGYMSLPADDYGKRNAYNKPIYFRARGFNYSKGYDIDNSVLIKNNALMKSTFEIVDYYTSILADIELTKNVHRNAHKTPFIIETNEATVLTAKNIFKKIRANEPVIFKNKAKGENEIALTINNPSVQYINDLLEDDYHNYEARILTVLGLDNYVEDKKERVQSAEVESNQEYIISSFRASLESRQKGCEAINKMFGTNLSVDYVKGEQIEDDKPIDDGGETDE